MEAWNRLQGLWTSTGDNKMEAQDILEDLRNRPLRTFIAMLLVSLVAIKWEERFEPVRRRLLRRNQEILHSTTSTRGPEAIFKKLWRHFKLVALCNLTSFGLYWILLFILCWRTTMPIFLFRIEMLLMIQGGFIAATLILDGYTAIAHRLGLPPLPPAPSQFHYGAPHPTASFD